jgi:glycosyltransferase involved in cell wall biosynthesis
MRNDQKPLFTVIIPTKDRADYLIHTLRTCTLQDYENLEVIVSDDGSSDNTRDVVEEAARNDSRIQYISPGSGVGMWRNFEYALNAVKPGYVMALGGDDGILPYGISGMLDVLNETEQELLAWPAPLYIYPKVRMDSGQLIISANKGRLETPSHIVNSDEYLKRQARDLSYVSDRETPMFYVKGVASTRLIDIVKSRSSSRRFYSSSTPDGFSGIVLAGEVKTFAYSAKPFSIYGASPTSQGSVYLGFNDKEKKQSEDFFRHAKDMPMHHDLASQPYSPLISLMTADFLLIAKDLPGWPGPIPKINYKSLISKALSELNGLWADDRILRELQIIRNIALHHGLEGYFNEELETKKRDSRSPLEGNAISGSRIYLDSDQFGIKNIFDAAFVSHYMYEIMPKLNLRTLKGLIVNSVNYWFKSLRKGKDFPKINAEKSIE